MKPYKSALDRLKRREDKLGRTIWIEKMGRGGKPTIYYVYDSHGRLMMHKRIQYGYAVEPARYERFGEQIQIEVEEHKRRDR